MSRFGRRAALLLGVSALAGCKLIDQSDFRPRPPPPPPAPPAPPAPPPVPPLVAIRFDKPGIDYQDALREAVTAARRRKVDVSFDVRGLTAAAPALGAQTANLTAVGGQVRGVADAIARLGVDPGRISLSTRAEPGITANEVRVYVH